jgi:hypothetical protein
MILLDSAKKHSGKYVCVYGASGVGKTVTTLQTAVGKIFWLTFEPRNIALSMEASRRDENDVDIGIYTSFLELMDFLNTPENFDAYTTVFCDGLSYFMNIAVSEEVKQENLTEKDKKENPIMALTKVTQPDRGEINQAVLRVLKRLGSVVARGKIVIVSCLESERRKYKIGEWDLLAGPTLGGNEVPDNFPGFFDLIGRMFTHQHDEDVQCVFCKKVATTTEIKYPPIISFKSDGNYLAKYTGKGGKSTGLLNWKKILK